MRCWKFPKMKRSRTRKCICHSICNPAVQFENICLKLCKISKVGDQSRGRPKGSLFKIYYTEVLGRAQLLSLDCSTLPLIRTLWCWMLSKEVSSTVFKVFSMTQPGTKPRSPGPLSNTLPTRPKWLLNRISSLKPYNCLQTISIWRKLIEKI